MATVAGDTLTANGFFNDYEPPDTCVDGLLDDGNDHVYVVTVDTGATLTATVTPTGGFDASIYLVAGPAAACDADPIVCLDGHDEATSDGAETATYTNSTGAGVDVMIVVDSWDSDVEGAYSLQVTVAP
jgi:hypothetical protein